MIGLIIKLILCPVMLVITDALFAGISYANIMQPIIVGLILAVVAHMMELSILRRGDLWASTLMDFVAAHIIIFISQYFFRNVTATFYAALFAAALLAVTEHFQHLYLLRSGRTQKTG